MSFTSLSEAFDALKSGSVKYVASDAVAGGYIALSYTGVDYAASLKSESLCYIGIPAKNTTLSEALSSSLTEISGNGVLQTVISKWAGTSTAEEITPTSVNTLTATTTASESTSTTTTGA